jgi:ketosteroid isomerase-like protein
MTMNLEASILPLAGLALALWTGGQEASDARKDDPGEVLVEADRAFLADTEERGLEGWLAWFADDATILHTDGSPVRGPAALRGHYRSLADFPPPGFRWEPESAGLASSADLGWTAGTYSIGDQENAGRYLTVWTKQPDGAWRVLTDLGGDVAFRTHLPGLSGPPVETATKALVSRTSKSGELSVNTGTWTAERGGSAIRGRFLSVWRRSEDGVWSIVTEIGSADS